MTIKFLLGDTSSASTIPLQVWPTHSVRLNMPDLHGLRSVFPVSTSQKIVNSLKQEQHQA